MSDSQQPKQSEHELRIEVLRVLDHFRKVSEDQPGGASGKMLIDNIAVEDARDLGKAVQWLRDNGYVTTGVRKFIITESGQEYLRKNMH